MENTVEWARPEREAQLTMTQTGRAKPPGQGTSRAARLRKRNKPGDEGAPSYLAAAKGGAAAKEKSTGESIAASCIHVIASPPAMVVAAVSSAVTQAEREARRIGFDKKVAESFATIAPALMTVCESLTKERHPAP